MELEDGDRGDWHHRSRPLDPDENVSIRKILDRVSPEKIDDVLDMLEEFDRYRWLWGLIGKISAWSAAIIGFIWAFRDQIAKVIRVIFPPSP